MERRAVLTLAGTVLFAGCGSHIASEATTDSRTRTPTTEPPEPTASPTPQLAIRDEYSFGEWHAMDHWKVTVRSLELTTTFQIDDVEKTFEMPDGEQLTIATAEVENTTSSRRGWATPFGFVVDAAVYESQMSFPHPEFEYDVDIRQLRRVEHQHQFQPEALPVDGGTTERLWAVAVVPRSVSREQVQVGLEVAPDDVLYPIRWTPT